MPDQPWLHWLAECPSTNTWAQEQGASLKSGDVVFTQRQTAGRGQQGRVWYAPPGVLTASFILDPVAQQQLSGFSLAVGFAVIQAIESLLPDQQGILQLKWPNDIWLAKSKLAGILCEVIPSGQPGHLRIIVGIGLNRCVDFDATTLDRNTLGKVISLHQVISQVPDEWTLLERLRIYLLQIHQLYALNENGFLTLLPQICARDALKDQLLSIELTHTSFMGYGAGIDDQGRLLIRLLTGGTQALITGRVRCIE